MIPLSKVAKREYDKNYSDKFTTESGGVVRVYDEAHIKKRWKQKEKALKSLESNIERLRKQYKKDLKSDNAKTRATAAMVGLIDGTAIRIGNDASAGESGTYGATTLLKKHISASGKKLRLNFLGKSSVKQSLVVEDPEVIKAIKELLEGKSGNDRVFELDDGRRVSGKILNRYLAKFNITAKSLRGFHANTLMKDYLKKYKWDKALKLTAEDVGHEEKTLENQYLSQALVKKYKPVKVPAKKSSLAQIPLAKLAYSAEGMEAEVDKILGTSSAPAKSYAPPSKSPQGAEKATSRRTDKKMPISSGFGERVHPLSGQTKMHHGIDIPQAAGSPVLAIQNGTVGRAGWENEKSQKQGLGLRVYINHPSGHTSLYGHLSKILVNSGDQVRKGQTIGFVGSTGASSGPHLHLELRDSQGQRIDPEEVIMGKN